MGGQTSPENKVKESISWYSYLFTFSYFIMTRNLFTIQNRKPWEARWPNG